MRQDIKVDLFGQHTLLPLSRSLSLPSSLHPLPPTLSPSPSPFLLLLCRSFPLITHTAAVIAVLILLLVMLLGAIASIVFLYWRSGVQPSTDEAISAQQVVHFETEIESLFQNVDAIEQNVNFTPYDFEAPPPPLYHHSFTVH